MDLHWALKIFLAFWVEVFSFKLRLKFIYRCGKTPLHLSAWITQQNYKTEYKTIMGGVTSFTKKQFEGSWCKSSFISYTVFWPGNTDINGYSNSYWGWGAEDDDLSNRVRSFYRLHKVPRPYEKKKDYKLFRLKHDRDKGAEKNEQRRALLSSWKQRWPHDGLNVSGVVTKNLTKKRNPD